MIGKLKDIMKGRGGEWVISFSTPEDFRESFDELADKEVSIEIKKHSRKRSLDANNFLWATCKDIADAMKPPITKEEVYRRAIREVGEYEPLPIKEEAVETFQERWSLHGTGWFAEVVDNSKIPGYKLVFAYYGSSTYSTESMSRLIDYVLQDAMALGIPIPTGKNKEDMLNAWSPR